MQTNVPTNTSNDKPKKQQKMHVIESDPDASNALSPPRITRIGPSSASKKRKHKTAREFKKEQTQKNALQRKKKKEDDS